MKKLIPLISLAAALMVAVFLPISAFADDQVEINTGNFPDKAFRQLVSEKFDKNQDDVLDEKEIGEATSLYMKSEKKAAKIRDLTGIGYLTELTYVDISGCKVKELKLGRNVKIESLYCRNMKKLKDSSEMEWAIAGARKRDVAGIRLICWRKCSGTQAFRRVSTK